MAKMSGFSSALDSPVILDRLPQKPIWCPAGIDLFVCLEIDPAETPPACNLSPVVSSYPADENPLEELEHGCTLLSLLLCSDNGTAGPERLYHDVNPRKCSSPDKDLDLELLSLKDISAAFKLMEMSNSEYTVELNHEEQEPLDGFARSNLGGGGGCGLKGLPTIVRKISVALMEIETRKGNAAAWSDQNNGFCWSEGDLPADDVEDMWRVGMRRIRPKKRSREDFNFRRSNFDKPFKIRHKFAKHFQDQCNIQETYKSQMLHSARKGQPSST